MSSSNGTSATARTPLRRNGAGSARAGAPFGASTATAKNSPMKMPPSAAALTEPPLPPDHYPATVYRYTKTRGWERYRSSTPQFVAARSRRRLLAMAGAASSSQAAAAPGGKGSTGSSATTDRQHMQQQQPVCAVPRRGCVEVRALRLRIRLFAEDDPSASGAENTSGATNNNQGGTVSGTTTSSKENTLVIRRSSRVLLSSRRNLGAVVLKFRSVPMAMDFCSRLMELNAAAYASGGATCMTGGGSGNGINDLGSIGTIGGSWMSNPMSLGGPPSSLSAMGMPKMQPSAGLGSHSSGGSSIGTSSITSNGEQQQQQQPEADMASYMVQLLHDPSFLSFVNSMESALTTSVAGGELMLKALAMSGVAASASSASS